MTRAPAAYDALGSFVFIPVGLAVTGPVADAIGVKETLWGAAAVVLVASLLVLGIPDVRRLTRQPDPQ